MVALIACCGSKPTEADKYAALAKVLNPIIDILKQDIGPTIALDRDDLYRAQKALFDIDSSVPRARLEPRMREFVARAAAANQQALRHDAAWSELSSLKERFDVLDVPYLSRATSPPYDADAILSDHRLVCRHAGAFAVARCAYLDHDAYVALVAEIDELRTDAAGYHVNIHSLAPE